jgi:hypothetical protein
VSLIVTGMWSGSEVEGKDGLVRQPPETLAEQASVWVAQTLSALPSCWA